MKLSILALAAMAASVMAAPIVEVRLPFPDDPAHFETNQADAFGHVLCTLN